MTRPTRLSVRATYEPFGLSTPTRGNAVLTRVTRLEKKIEKKVCPYKQSDARSSVRDNVQYASKMRNVLPRRESSTFRVPRHGAEHIGRFECRPARRAHRISCSTQPAGRALCQIRSEARSRTGASGETERPTTLGRIATLDAQRDESH